MGIDWTQYLGEMQKQQGASEQPSIFPATPWSNLASLIRTAGIGMAAPKAQAQQSMMSMLTQAKEFGTPGLRKLYADPEFQRLVKTTGSYLPPLPDLTPQERLAERENQYLTEAETQAAGVTHTTYGPTEIRDSRPPGVETPLPEGVTREGAPPPVTGISGATPGDWRRIYASLAIKYPEAAEALGIVKRLTPIEVTALIRGGMDFRVDPMKFLNAIDTALSTTGQSLDTVDDTTRAMIINTQIGPYAQAQIDNLNANFRAKMAQAGLTTEKMTELQKSFPERLAKDQAEVNLLIQKGKLTEAMARQQQINNQYQAEIDQTKINVGASVVDRNEATAALARADVGFRIAQTRYTDARTVVIKRDYPNTSAGWKLKAASYYNLMRMATERLVYLQKYLISGATLPEGATIDGIQKEINQVTADLNSYTAIYQSAAAGLKGPEGTPLNAPDISHLNKTVKTILDVTINDPTVWSGTEDQVRANVIAKFNEWRRNKGAGNLNAKDWQGVWDYFSWNAFKNGVVLPETMPSGR